MEINNMDIAGLVQRLDRFMVEVFKSATANVSEVRQFDKARLLSYLNAMTRYHAWVTDQPQLDLSETAPRTYTIPDMTDYAQAENESVNDILRMMTALRLELLNSQSARNPCGFISHDSGRFTALVEKMNRFVLDYIDEVAPLDLPESSPRVEQTGAGLTGI